MPGRTRSAATKATPKKATSKYSLGTRVQGEFHDIKLPSGHTVSARRPGVQGFISAGILDNFDELTAIVQMEHIVPKTPRGVAATARVTPEQSGAAAMELLRDKDKLAAAFHMIDRLAAYVINEPKVWIDYQAKGESDEDWLERQGKAEEEEAFPIREVDLEDKMFLMEWSMGGTSDVAAFRKGSGQLLGNMAAG